MKFKKTPQGKRETYKLFDDDNNFVAEYTAGENEVTEVDILNLHRLDDHEVYVNCKEIKLPEWYQPIHDEWKARFIADFRERHGRVPFADEIPDKYRRYISVDAQIGTDGDELGDSGHLEEELSVTDRDDEPDEVLRLREVVSDMPDTWQRIYNLVMLEGRSQTETARLLGLSNARVGQLLKKISTRIAEDKILKSFFE